MKIEIEFNGGSRFQTYYGSNALIAVLQEICFGENGITSRHEKNEVKVTINGRPFDYEREKKRIESEDEIEWQNQHIK